MLKELPPEVGDNSLSWPGNKRPRIVVVEQYTVCFEMWPLQVKNWLELVPQDS